LEIIELLFVRVAFEVAPVLQFHRRPNDVRARRAAAPELRLALGGVDVRGRGANDARAAGGIGVVIDLGVAEADAVGLVVLQVIDLLLVRLALEVGPGLKFEGGDVVRASRSEAVHLRLSLGGIDAGRDRAHETGRVGRVFVVIDRRVADGGAVGAIALNVIGLFFVRHTLEVRPGLELHVGGERVRARGAAAVKLRLALGGIDVRGRRAHETRRVRRVLVIMKLGVPDGGAVEFVILEVIGLFLVGHSLEVGPSLELEARDVVGAGGAAAVELGFLLGGVRSGSGRARESRGVRGVFVVMERRVADRRAVGLVVL